METSLLTTIIDLLNDTIRAFPQAAVFNASPETQKPKPKLTVVKTA